MQESRLFRILYYLLDKGRATAPELAEKFEVSVRTIYRDVDVMSSAGIPKAQEQSDGPQTGRPLDTVSRGLRRGWGATSTSIFARRKW